MVGWTGFDFKNFIEGMILGADVAHSFRCLGVLAYKHTVPLAQARGVLDGRPGFQIEETEVYQLSKG